MPAAWIGAAAAVAGAAGSMSGGGTSGGSGYYIPTGLAGADTTWSALLNTLGNDYNTTNLNQYGLSSLQNGMGALGQYSGGYQNAANAAGQQYGNLGGQLTNAAGLQFGQQQPLLNAGQQVYNTALDPQNALYNRTVQQLQEQTGATNSMYGLGSSAAGAGVANQALGNFNIDWQNQQLQRQLSGLQGYGQAVQQAGQAGAQGGALGQAGAGATLQGGQLPFQTAQGLAAVPGQLANTYGQFLNQNVYGPAEGLQGQIIPYLNYGQGAQAVPYQNQLAGQGAAGALISQGINTLGNNPQVQSALSSAFGGGGASGSFSGGNFGNAFSSSPYYSGGGNQYGFTMG